MALMVYESGYKLLGKLQTHELTGKMPTYIVPCRILLKQVRQEDNLGREYKIKLYGKQLSTRLSLMVSLMASFVLSFFPLDVLDEIWDLIESVSEGFLTYSCLQLTVQIKDSHFFWIKH